MDHEMDGIHGMGVDCHFIMKCVGTQIGLLQANVTHHKMAGCPVRKFLIPSLIPCLLIAYTEPTSDATVRPDYTTGSVR